MGLEAGIRTATLNSKEQTQNKPGRVNTCQVLERKVLRLEKGLITVQGQEVRSENLFAVMGQGKKRTHLATSNSAVGRRSRKARGTHSLVHSVFTGRQLCARYIAQWRIQR